MTFATNGAQLAIDTMALQAANETADVTIDLRPGYGGLVAEVGGNKTDTVCRPVWASAGRP